MGAPWATGGCMALVASAILAGPTALAPPPVAWAIASLVPGGEGPAVVAVGLSKATTAMPRASDSPEARTLAWGHGARALGTSSTHHLPGHGDWRWLCAQCPTALCHSVPWLPPQRPLQPPATSTGPGALSRAPVPTTQYLHHAFPLGSP